MINVVSIMEKVHTERGNWLRKKKRNCSSYLTKMRKSSMTNTSSIYMTELLFFHHSLEYLILYLTILLVIMCRWLEEIRNWLRISGIPCCRHDKSCYCWIFRLPNCLYLKNRRFRLIIFGTYKSYKF